MKTTFLTTLISMSTLAASGCSTALLHNPETASQPVAQTTDQMATSSAAPAKSPADLAREMLTKLSSELKFDVNSAELKPVAKQDVSQLGSVLSQVKDLSIEVDGYTDPSGGAKINKPLSQKRASSVRALLIHNGVSAERIHASGKAELNPVTSNDTAEGRAENRRAEIKLD